ncbi:hypothetical protein BO221_50070 [Archangium sp. Cb G35]|uniref:hypothetical protein n=1 Tax=Archangium sp. Cb G35 TaxID=1920190 RepID=UPI00093796A0|nr:hypothetical protein [Archangium sp. Cb G35]OJT16472.1 hypothetical protein BO221_50070 [Archangium sp. Cb G35]
MGENETSPANVFWAAAQRRDAAELVMTVGGVLLSGLLVVALGWMLQEATYSHPCEGFSLGAGLQEPPRDSGLWHDSESPLMSGERGR